MKIVSFTLLIYTVFFLSSGCKKPQPLYEVIEIVDGNTILVRQGRMNRKVHLIGIQEGEKAVTFLKTLVDKKVALIPDSRHPFSKNLSDDMYAYVSLVNGKNNKLVINQYLLENKLSDCQLDTYCNDNLNIFKRYCQNEEPDSPKEEPVPSAEEIRAFIGRYIELMQALSKSRDWQEKEHLSVEILKLFESENVIVENDLRATSYKHIVVTQEENEKMTIGEYLATVCMENIEIIYPTSKCDIQDVTANTEYVIVEVTKRVKGKMRPEYIALNTTTMKITNKD